MPNRGSMRLHDAVDPALDAGRYRIRSHADTRDTARPLPSAVQHLEVTGPRFALEPGDVVSRHPPRDAVGGYGEDLPHVVLGRRTLPWERRGLGSGAPPGTPWVALLLLRADEAELAANTALADVVGAARAARFPDPRQPVTAVTLAPGLSLEQLLPRPDEMALLTHVREVNVADTALAGQDDDGWLAVVVGNRVAVGGEEPGLPYLACLVSLEERDDLLAGSPEGRSLVVLHAWRFTSTSAGGTFRRLLQDADRALIGEASADAAHMGALGHVELAGTDRGGRPVSGAYRGPLVARPVAEPRRDEVPGPDGKRLPDRSLEVARELGRLLGAADGRFLRELDAWRRGELLGGERGAVSAGVSRALAAVPAAAPLAARAARASSAPTARQDPAAEGEALPTLAAAGALLRVLEARLPRADAWGIPPAARAAARHAHGSVTARSPTGPPAPGPAEDLESLRRRRRSAP